MREYFETAGLISSNAPWGDLDVAGAVSEISSDFNLTVSSSDITEWTDYCSTISEPPMTLEELLREHSFPLQLLCKPLGNHSCMCSKLKDQLVFLNIMAPQDNLQNITLTQSDLSEIEDHVGSDKLSLSYLNDWIASCGTDPGNDSQELGSLIANDSLSFAMLCVGEGNLDCSCDTLLGFFKEFEIVGDQDTDFSNTDVHLAASTLNVSTSAINTWTSWCDNPEGTDAHFSNLLLEHEYPFDLAIKCVPDPRNEFCAALQAQDSAIREGAIQNYVDSVSEHYLSEYLQQGWESANQNEILELSYTPKQYAYTLYYYDQAGNLIKTVPPPWCS